MGDFAASFNNRDIALLIWLAIFTSWMLLKPTIRRSLRPLGRLALNRHIFTAFLIAAATTALLSYFFSLAGLWTVTQLKVSIAWFLVACVPSILDVPALSKNFSLFQTVALNNFKLSIVVDFYINLFHAPLAVELVVLPFATLLVLMIVVAESKEELRDAHGILTTALAILGLGWLAFQTYKLLTSFGEIQTLDTLRDFVLPIALNLSFLPVLVLYAAYGAYDSAFSRAQFFVKDPALLRFAKFALVIRCGLNYMKVNRWIDTAWKGQLISRRAIWDSIGASPARSRQSQDS